jgi:hypothetical protein
MTGKKIAEKVVSIPEKDQQDAPLSHYFIPIKLPFTCSEQTR